jgi:predicted RNase H-like nuclease (RuvC/YqgF family)
VGGSPERTGEAQARREGRKVDELNRIISCKNSEIATLRQELSWKSYDGQALRKRLEELDCENAALKGRLRVLESLAVARTI